MHFSRVFIFLIFLSSSVFAQKVENIPAMKQQKQPYDNIATQALGADSNVTSTVIWIKKEVRPHYHATHSEHVYVVEGNGQMLLGNETVFVGPGDLIYIPQGMIHALRVTSKDKPMKVISIQAPEFDGSDRVMVDKTGW